MDFVRQAINNIAQTAKKKFNDNEGIFRANRQVVLPQAISQPIRQVQNRIQIADNFYQKAPLVSGIYNPIRETAIGAIDFAKMDANTPLGTQAMKYGQTMVSGAKSFVALQGAKSLAGMKIPQALINIGVSAGLGGAMNKYMGGSFKEGAISGVNTLPSIMGVGKFTNPVIDKFATKVGGKVVARLNNPMAKSIGDFATQRLATGVANIPEGVLMSGAMGRNYTPSSAVTDFALGAITGKPGVNKVTTSKLGGMDDLYKSDMEAVQRAVEGLRRNFKLPDGTLDINAHTQALKEIEAIHNGYKLMPKSQWKKLPMDKQLQMLVMAMQDKQATNPMRMGIYEGSNRPTQALDPKNFKSAEEYVKAQRKMYRGGTEYNPARVNSKSEVFNGVALTESPERAKFYTAGTQGRGGEKGRFVQELFIDNKANIASQEHIPQSLWATMEPEDIARWAKENGYDGVDLRSLGGSIAQADKEIRIFNPDMLQTKSQLTDIWNKANNVTSPIDGKSKLRNLSGGIAGVEMYQDENGKWQTRYNPVKGIAGVVGMTATSKMGGKDIQEKLNMARQNLQEAMDSRQFKAEMRDMFTGGQRQAIASLQRSMASLERKGSDITNVMNTPSYKKVIYDVMSQIGTDSEDEAIQFIKQYDGKLPNVSVAINELRNTIKEAKEIERLNPSNYEELIKQDPKLMQQMLGSETPYSITTTKQAERLGTDNITQTAKEASSLTDSTGIPKFMSNLPIEEDGSAKARGVDIKRAYEEWVNARRATKLEGVLKQKELSELDAKGVEGIMDYQVGKTNTKVREYFDAKYKELKDAGIEFGYQKDYLPQLWDNTAEEISTAMGRSLGIRPTFSMEKVIKDYKTGIALGLKPRFQTVGELAGWYERTANKALADNKFFKHLYDDGQILLGDSAPKGWQTISPDRFPKIRVSGELGDYKGTFKAEPETAKLINNYLNDASDETLQKVADYVSKVKNITLNFGIPGTAINSHGVNILARHTLFGTGGNPITRFLTGAKYMINPRSAERYLDTSMQRAPQAIKNGLTLSAEGYEGVGTEALGFKGRFGKKWEQAFGDPLFQKMIPSLKLSSYEELVKNNMDPKDASKLVNTVYGGINWEAMGRDRNMQNWARAIILAPDWAETTLRIGGNIAKSLNPLNKGMVMNRYRTMGATALGSIVALNVANKISSGHYAYENEPGHTFELESGYTNDGQKRYIRPFGTALDMVRLPFDIAIGLSKGDPSVAVRAFTNRLSIPLSSTAHLAFNIDYKGQKIYGQDKYGNPIEPLQAVGGITSEVAGLTGFPSFAKNLVDSATGKQGIEQGITQALELPFRYTNTGKSALSKQVAPLANLKGKELYDLNASLKGESKLSDNQMEDAMMGAKPIEVVKSIIGDRQANRADKLLDTTQGADTDPTRMEYGEGGHKNIKALDREIKKIETRVKKGYMSPEAGEIMKQNRMDSYGGSQSDLDNYKKEMQAVAPYKTQTENVKQLQAKVPTTQYAMVKKQQEQIALASTIYNNDKLTEEMKTSLLNKLSVSKSDMEYYQIAKDTVDMKQIYVNEQIQGLRNNGAGDQEVYKWLKDNQKEVNGKSIVTATILKQLAGEGQISYTMSGALKKVTTGKVKLRAGRKVKKPKKLGKIKVSYKAPKLTKLKVKIPKLAKIKMLKPKKVKTA